LELDHPATLSFSGQRFRHVFVLCTGRCGSVAFAKACGHFTNYSAGHETNRATGRARLDYPGGHIEIDNRLAWFLGELEERYGDHALYVHLVRDESQVAASYDRRWHHQGSLIRGFNESICGHTLPGPEAADDLVAAMNANIRAFLRDKTHVITGNIDNVTSWFPQFASAIGAAGALQAALEEFGNRHNASDRHPSGQPQSADAQRSRESVPVVRAVKRNQVLQAERASLRAERSVLGAKLKRARRLNWTLAVACLLGPMVAMFVAAPLGTTLAAILLSLTWLTVRTQLKAVAKRLLEARCWQLVFPFQKQRGRSVVFDAFLAYQAQGPERANAILDRAGRACPAGAKELFRAMSSQSDAEWLAATNAWAAAASLPEIALRPGAEPRFERLTLAAVEPVFSRDKVSVIMPAFNAQATIEQAARSILAQSWRNLELIIVDDCSSDGIADVAERLAAEDARVRVLRNPANVGPYVSKNQALLAATGRYVTGHDADDIAIPTRIADQMQPIRDDTACVATIASMIRLDRDGAFSYPTKVGSYSYDGIARRAMISLLIDRQVLLEQIGFWDTVRFGADSEMLARTSAVLGPRLREVRKVVMLCLNVEGSLTNNENHGISAWDGVSPIRKAYRDAWAAWHAATPVEQRRLPFPHIDRQFESPEGMRVNANALRAVLAADAVTRCRAA
jgi:hypothetical protein